MSKKIENLPANQNSIPDGIPVKVEKSEENWSECLLEDGARIRFKPVIMEVQKLSQLGPDGNPIYVVRSTLLMDTTPPKKKKN